MRPVVPRADRGAGGARHGISAHQSLACRRRAAAAPRPGRVPPAARETPRRRALGGAPRPHHGPAREFPETAPARAAKRADRARYRQRRSAASRLRQQLQSRRGHGRATLRPSRAPPRQGSRRDGAARGPVRQGRVALSEFRDRGSICNASALMTTPRSCSARPNAKADLPLAVGPAIMTTLDVVSHLSSGPVRR